MGEEAAVERYEPGPAFEEVKEEAMLDMSLTDSKEFLLIQWIKDKDLDVAGFHGKELSLKLHKDGNLGRLESSSGKSYDLVSYAYQKPNATVFLPSGSEPKAVGKISRRVCLIHHREPEKWKKRNCGSLTPSSKKSAVLGAQSNTATETLQITPEEPPKKKVKIGEL